MRAPRPRSDSGHSFHFASKNLQILPGPPITLFFVVVSIFFSIIPNLAILTDSRDVQESWEIQPSIPRAGDAQAEAKAKAQAESGVKAFWAWGLVFRVSGIYSKLGLYRDNGKENGNHYLA